MELETLCAEDTYVVECERYHIQQLEHENILKFLQGNIYKYVRELKHIVSCCFYIKLQQLMSVSLHVHAKDTFRMQPLTGGTAPVRLSVLIQ